MTRDEAAAQIAGVIAIFVFLLFASAFGASVALLFTGG